MTITGGTSNGKTKTIEVISNEKPGTNNVYGSRNKDFNRDDGRVLLRFNIPTSKIWEIDYITQVYVKANYGVGGNNFLDGTWNLQDCTVYQSYFWKNRGGDGYLATNWRLNNYNKYSNNTISTPITYDGKIEISALQNDETSNKVYFDSEVALGYLEVIFYFSQYLSEDSYRIPNNVKFIDTKNEKTKTISLSDIFSFSSNHQTSEITYIWKASSKTFESFTTIDAVQVEFCDGRYIAIPIDCKLKNISKIKDNPEEFEIRFSGEENKNIFNEYIEIFEDEGEKKVKLKSRLKGSLTLPINCPYILKEDGESYLIDENGNDISTKPNLSSKEKENLSIEIEDDYDCFEEEIEGNNTKLSFENCILKEGKYKIKAEFYNKLEFSTDNTITWTLSKELSVGKKKDEVAFLKTPEISIKYLNESNTSYSVPGNILLDWENLIFSSAGFNIYSLEDGQKIEQTNENIFLTINEKVTDISVKIGSNKYNYSTLKDSYAEIFNLSEEEKDREETIKLLLGYSLKNKVAYGPTDIFFLGRIIKEINHENKKLETLNTKNNTINYILLDNGGDQNVLDENNSWLTQNLLIEKRKRKERYFSLSRQPEGNALLHEQIELSLNVKGESTLPPIEMNIDNEEKLSEALDLLKINKTQSFPLELFGLNVESVLDKEIEITITIYYIYGPQEKRILTSYKTGSLIFSSVVSPLGLRKEGVIINPKRDENIEASNGRKNTFIINVPETKKNDSSTYVPINGLRIFFDSDKYFEIFLDEKGEICFATDKGTFKPNFS